MSAVIVAGRCALVGAAGPALAGLRVEGLHRGRRLSWLPAFSSAEFVANFVARIVARIGYNFVARIAAKIGYNFVARIAAKIGYNFVGRIGYNFVGNLGGGASTAATGEPLAGVPAVASGASAGSARSRPAP